MEHDPAALRIRTHPDPVLRVKADPVDPTPEVMAVADRMVEIMRGAEGIGLAATQVGLPWRLFVADVPPPPEDPAPGELPAGLRASTDGPAVFINPTVDAYEGSADPFEEGCLSLPGVRGDVLRPPGVVMSAIGRDARPFTVRAVGLLARCLQHELDHLDGVLIIDKMTQRSRSSARAAIKRLERGA